MCRCLGVRWDLELGAWDLTFYKPAIQSASLGLGRHGSEDPHDRAGDAPPLALLARELLAAGARERVEPGLAVFSDVPHSAAMNFRSSSRCNAGYSDP